MSEGPSRQAGHPATAVPAASAPAMDGVLDVYFTVDVEVWCDGWDELDRKFPDAFRRYVYGPTARGDYGLPLQLKVLGDHGLHGIFFVESLFSARFGAAPLAEIVSLIVEARQDVQLHLHPEWAHEARDVLLPGLQGARRHLSRFTLGEQTTLIAAGKRLLEEAGADPVRAFRTGSFDFNADTLRALQRNGIALDASYNATRFGPASGVCPGDSLTDSLEHDGIVELPMTVFHDGLRRLRHVQLTACSWAEMEALLWQALQRGQRSFVILSHNFELMDPAKTRPDRVVAQRFRKLCSFLERHRGRFRTRRLDLPDLPRTSGPQPTPLDASWWRTGIRLAEQMQRRRAA